MFILNLVLILSSRLMWQVMFLNMVIKFPGHGRFFPRSFGFRISDVGEEALALALALMFIHGGYFQGRDPSEWPGSLAARGCCFECSGPRTSLVCERDLGPLLRVFLLSLPC